jgi:hypothetical protein
LGVGEYVNFAFNPPVNMTYTEQPWWLVIGGGSVMPHFGDGTLFTAPSNAASASVRVFVRDVQLDTTFSVKEPSGFDSKHTRIINTYPTIWTADQVGALMLVKVHIAPTFVSFYRVELAEIDGPATGVTGYFQNFTSGDLYHWPGGFAPIDCDNSWGIGDTCGKLPPGYEWPWPGKGPEMGSYIWANIPIAWKIGNQTTLVVPGWTSQTFSVSVDGTVTVEKYGGLKVKRTIQNVTTPSLP